MQIALFYKGKEVKTPLYSRVSIDDISAGIQVVFPSTEETYMVDEVRIYSDEDEHLSTHPFNGCFDMVVQVRGNI